MEFVYEHAFTQVADEFLDDDAMHRVEAELTVNPRKGNVIVGTNGVRKLRGALPGRGKSGSARLIYVYIEVGARIHFVKFYAKNTQADLTQAEKREVRMLAQRFREEL